VAPVAPAAPVAPVARRGTSIGGLVRLVHPFPSLLNAGATAAVAALAGADPLTSLRLGAAMLAIQCSIGALNDLVDEPLDAREKPRKPIPSGEASRRAATVVVLAGALVALALSAVSGISTAIAALGCLGLGYLYDLRLSRTALSWLPLSLALPLLPIHAWLGATGVIPPGLLTLGPVAVLAGAGLSLANGLVDVERDARAGRQAVTVALGRERTWLVQTLALGLAVALALWLAPTDAVAAPGSPAVPSTGGLLVDPAVLHAIRAVGVPLGAALVGLGAAVLLSRGPARRERGWELEAVGVAGIGLGWLAGTALAAAGGGAL
jgi:4-hydroxybenzoate polyprenyltransferase